MTSGRPTTEQQAYDQSKARDAPYYAAAVAISADRQSDVAAGTAFVLGVGIGFYLGSWWPVVAGIAAALFLMGFILSVGFRKVQARVGFSPDEQRAILKQYKSDPVFRAAVSVFMEGAAKFKAETRDGRPN